MWLGIGVCIGGRNQVRTVSRFTLSRRFFCVPAKRQHSVMMNAMNAVIVGKMLLRSIMVGG